VFGVGNCASSLLQGIEFYKHAPDHEKQKPVGLVHYDLGG
jgi:myo-inositol-1-phosphate synthase